MTVTVIMAVVATAVLAGLAVLQVLVACGLPYGRLVWGGRSRVLPARLRVGSVISVILYAGFALVLLSRAGVVPGGDSGFIVVATWMLFAYFALGVLVNAISRSIPERVTMAPVSLVLACCALVIALAA